MGAERLLADPLNSAHIWKRSDGAWALVQTWPRPVADDAVRTQFGVVLCVLHEPSAVGGEAL